MSEKSTALNIIQKKQQLNNPTLINRVTFAVFYSLFVCLFKQYSHFANGCCRLTVYFGNRLAPRLPLGKHFFSFHRLFRHDKNRLSMTIPASIPIVLVSQGFFPYIRTDI